MLWFKKRKEKKLRAEQEKLEASQSSETLQVDQECLGAEKETQAVGKLRKNRPEEVSLPRTPVGLDNVVETTTPKSAISVASSAVSLPTSVISVASSADLHTEQGAVELGGSSTEVLAIVAEEEEDLASGLGGLRHEISPVLTLKPSEQNAWAHSNTPDGEQREDSNTMAQVSDDRVSPAVIRREESESSMETRITHTTTQSPESSARSSVTSDNHVSPATTSQDESDLLESTDILPPPPGYRTPQNRSREDISIRGRGGHRGRPGPPRGRGSHGPPHAGFRQSMPPPRPESPPYVGNQSSPFPHFGPVKPQKKRASHVSLRSVRSHQAIPHQPPRMPESVLSL